MVRCFIAIKVPKQIIPWIGGIQKDITGFKGKKIEGENLHLTLKFFGEVSYDEVKEIRKRLNEIKFKNFETSVDGLGIFSEKFIRIIWLHLNDCDRLQKEIDEKLSYLFKREINFRSHLTIARVKVVKNKKQFLKKIKKIKIPLIKFPVNEFLLMKSTLTRNGPQYEIIEKYILK